nr:MAG TPA: hypothetical protein [Caudoviricetes sp.]
MGVFGGKIVDFWVIFYIFSDTFHGKNSIKKYRKKN